MTMRRGENSPEGGKRGRICLYSTNLPLFPPSGAISLLALLVTWAPSARAAGALEAVAAQGAKGIGAQRGAAMVVSAPLVSDTAAPKGEELAVRLAQLVAGAVGGAAH